MSPVPRSQGPTLSARLIHDPAARLAEGPVWDERVGALVWVDILEGRVCVSESDGTLRQRHQLNGCVGAAMPAHSGWLIVTDDGFAHLGDDGELETLIEPEADNPDVRFNDARCDPAGRAIAGTMRYDVGPGDGVLYRLDVRDPDPGTADRGDASLGLTAVPLLERQGLCNGLGWSPDGTTFYYIDSLERTLAAHPYDLATGTLGQPRTVVYWPPGPGMPDGLCVDAEGGIWVAMYGSGVVERWLPDGTLAARVTLPVAHPTCPAFGGPQLDHLYITTACLDDDPDAPGTGGLWLVDAPGVRGAPATPWRASALS